MDEYGTEPPDLSKVELVFDQFHPLDHWPWQCGDLYGGWRNHLSMTWHYRRKPSLRAATKCKVGWHHPVQYWQGRQPNMMTWKGCRDCGKPLSKKQTT